MAEPMQLKLTNLRLPTYSTADAESRRGEVEAFDSLLRLEPLWDEKVITLMRSSKKQALRTVSATAYLHPDLASHISAEIGRTVSDEEIVFSLIWLLSFITRRGVGFRKPQQLKQAGKPIIRGQVESTPLLYIIAEYQYAIERGLPKMMSPEYREVRHITTALLWFLGWKEEPFVEMRFVRLFIVLEMLAKSHHRFYNLPLMSDPNKIRRLLDDLDVPGREHFPIDDFFNARNWLVHGDVKMAYDLAAQTFGQYVVGWRDEIQQFFGNHPNLPDPTNYNDALFQAGDLLARMLERVFMKLLDIKSYLPLTTQ